MPAKCMCFLIYDIFNHFKRNVIPAAKGLDAFIFLKMSIVSKQTDCKCISLTFEFARVEKCVLFNEIVTKPLMKTIMS